MSQPRRAWPEGGLQRLLARAEGGESCPCGAALHPLQGAACEACRRSPSTPGQQQETTG